MLDDITLQMILRLCLASLLGGVVGIERGSGDRPAGLRTHILVSAGSALLMLVSAYAFQDWAGNHDPGRIAAQVVSGIGFLGAGTILHAEYYRSKSFGTSLSLPALLSHGIFRRWYGRLRF